MCKAAENDCHDIFEFYSDENIVRWTSIENTIIELNWYDKISKEQLG